MLLAETHVLFLPGRYLVSEPDIAWRMRKKTGEMAAPQVLSVLHIVY